MTKGTKRSQSRTSNAVAHSWPSPSVYLSIVDLIRYICVSDQGHVQGICIINKLINNIFKVQRPLQARPNIDNI